MNESRGIWLAVSVAMISISAGGWATESPAKTASSGASWASITLLVIAAMGISILIIVLLRTLSAHHFRRKLSGFIDNYVQLQQRTFEVENDDQDAFREILEQVRALGENVKIYLFHHKYPAHVLFAIDTGRTEADYINGTFPEGLVKTEIQIRLTRLTEITARSW